MLEKAFHQCWVTASLRRRRSSTPRLTRGVQVNDNTHLLLLLNYNGAPVSLFGVYTWSKEKTGKEQRNYVGGRGREMHDKSHALLRHTRLKLLCVGWILPTGDFTSLCPSAPIISQQQQNKAARRVIYEIKSYTNMCCLAQSLTHKRRVCLIRPASVFLFWLAQHQLTKEDLGKPVVTQAPDMPCRGKITVWKALNTIALGYMKLQWLFICSPFENKSSSYF